MTGIFAVPRAIIFWKREYAATGAFGPTGDLTIRIYRFSLGLGCDRHPHRPLGSGGTGDYPLWVLDQAGGLVALLAGPLWLDRATGAAARARGSLTESDMWLRIFNEISVLGAIGVLIIVVFKPF